MAIDYCVTWKARGYNICVWQYTSHQELRCRRKNSLKMGGLQIATAAGLLSRTEQRFTVSRVS